MGQNKIYMDDDGKIVDAENATQCVIITTDKKGQILKREYYYAKNSSQKKGNDMEKIAGLSKVVKLLKGGPGSGNFGHAGRPGEVGGSSGEGGSAPDKPVPVDRGTPDEGGEKIPPPDKGWYKEVAETIHRQLGGRQFTTMTGAKNFTFGDKSLSFRIPKASKGINAVKVTLNAEDTYDVEFMRIRGTNVKTVSSHEGIYNDQLRGLFERETGLATSLTHRYDKGITKLSNLLKGGEGSGNFGHAGRPGERGGSAKEGGGGGGSGGGKGKSIKRGDDDFKYALRDIQLEYVESGYPGQTSYAYHAERISMDEGYEAAHKILRRIEEIKYDAGRNPLFRLRGEKKWRSPTDSDDFPQPDTEPFEREKGLSKLSNLLKGGEGSGNFGHSGRPGEVGGSSSGGGGGGGSEDKGGEKPSSGESGGRAPVKTLDKNTERQLVHILTQEDIRRERRGERNNSRLALFFEALDRAKADSKGIEHGLKDNFEESGLLDKMLRSIGALGKGEKYIPNKKTGYNREGW